VRYLIAVILPPLAVFLCGKPFQAIISILLTLCLWVPGVIHALLVVHAHLADVRTDKIVSAIKEKE
jgi:uncharacterized membrane protein YqaE (UPF0057 family)